MSSEEPNMNSNEGGKESNPSCLTVLGGLGFVVSGLIGLGVMIFKDSGTPVPPIANFALKGFFCSIVAIVIGYIIDAARRNKS
jgi:ABC-type antimicrobial peptide transport system permease subunit